MRVQDQDEEAEPFFRDAFEGLRRTLGPAHRDTLAVASSFSRCLYSLGFVVESERPSREVLSLSSSTIDTTWMALAHLGTMLLDQGHFAELRQVFDDPRARCRSLVRRIP